MSKKLWKLLGVAGAVAVGYVGKKVYDKYKDEIHVKANELKEEIVEEVNDLKENPDVQNLIAELEKAKDVLLSVTEDLSQNELKEVGEKIEQGRERLMAKVRSLDVEEEELVEEVVEPDICPAQPQEEKPVVETKKVEFTGDDVEKKLIKMIKNAKSEVIISVPNLTWDAYRSSEVFDLIRKKVVDEKVYVKINCGVGEFFDWHNQMVDSIRETIEVAHELKKEFRLHNNFTIDIKDSNRKVLICDKQKVFIVSYSFLAKYLKVENGKKAPVCPGVKCTGTYIESKEYACDLIKTIENLPKRNREVDSFFFVNSF